MQNFYGTIDLTEKLLPLITNGGKVVTVGSTAGVMTFKRITNENLKQRLQNPNLTKKDLFDILHEFETGVANSTYAEQGWPKWSYGVSKLGINIYNRVLGQFENVVGRKIQTYVCCPGFVKTDMSSHKGHLTVEEGIRTPIFLIELPFEFTQERQGGFFYLEKLASLYE